MFPEDLIKRSARTEIQPSTEVIFRENSSTKRSSRVEFEKFLSGLHDWLVWDLELGSCILFKFFTYLNE